MWERGLSSLALWCHQETFVSVHQHFLAEPLQAHKMIAAALGMLFAFRLEMLKHHARLFYPLYQEKQNVLLFA